MCKPEVSDITIRVEGPCSLIARTYGDACAAWSAGMSWRVSLANVLRRLADRAEGGKSFTVMAFGPSQLTGEDACEALAHGMAGAAKYLNEVWRERTEVTVSEDPQPVFPPTKIS